MQVFCLITLYLVCLFQIRAQQEVILACDDQCWVYWNGENINQNNDEPSARQWYNYFELKLDELTYGNHVIAIKAYNGRGRGGILTALTIGSQIDARIGWKLSENETDGWNTMNFNDTAWIKPPVYDLNSPRLWPMTQIKKVSNDQPLPTNFSATWRETGDNQRRSYYYRYEFEILPTFTSQYEGTCVIYLNDQQIFLQVNQSGVKLNIKRGKNVLAVKVEANSTTGSTRFKSNLDFINGTIISAENENWKCSSENQTNWYLRNFDDSDWNNTKREESGNGWVTTPNSVTMIAFFRLQFYPSDLLMTNLPTSSSSSSSTSSSTSSKSSSSTSSSSKSSSSTSSSTNPSTSSSTSAPSSSSSSFSSSSTSWSTSSESSSTFPSINSSSLNPTNTTVFSGKLDNNSSSTPISVNDYCDLISSNCTIKNDGEDIIFVFGTSTNVSDFQLGFNQYLQVEGNLTLNGDIKIDLQNVDSSIKVHIDGCLDAKDSDLIVNLGPDFEVGKSDIIIIESDCVKSQFNSVSLSSEFGKSNLQNREDNSECLNVVEDYSRRQLHLLIEHQRGGCVSDSNSIFSNQILNILILSILYFL